MIFDKTTRALGRGGRPLRIAYGRIFHEACAFSPLRTERDAFAGMHDMAGDELHRATTLRGTELASFMPHAELTGFRQAARLAGDVETVPLISALAVPSGPLTQRCFGSILDDLLAKLRSAGRLDGVYIALHGSMQVEGLGEAPEGLILRRVREVVGEEAKIAVSYDLHANLSAGLLDPAEVVIAYRTNPHWDLAPTGFRAGNRLIRALRGQVAPTHAWRKMPIVLGGGTTIDFMAPMRSVFRWMRALEDDPKVLSASLFMVHPYTSADDLGWAAHVCTDGDDRLANRLAEELADRAWSQRNATLPPMRGVDEALDEVKRGFGRKVAPVTLVDVDDIVGAGAPGGNTHFVQALARDDRGLTSLVPLHDPAAVDTCWDKPVGSKVSITLRGTPGYEQPEVPVEGVVAARFQDDRGRRVRLDVGGMRVALCEEPPLPIHPSFWKELGSPPRKADLLVQKNFFHYRMFYAATSFQHVPVVSAGATSLERIRNRTYRVPTHPQTPLDDWRAGDLPLREPAGGGKWAPTDVAAPAAPPA